MYYRKRANVREPHQFTWSKMLLGILLHLSRKNARLRIVGNVPVVEGSLRECEDEEPGVLPLDEDAQILAQRYYHTRHRQRWLLVAMAGLVVLTLGTVGGAYVFWWSTATVVVHPAKTTRESVVSLTLPFPPSSPAGESMVRLLTATQTSQVPVRATGIRVLTAMHATGSLVGYNQMPFAQTIPAGTSFSVSPGVDVTLDADLLLPPGHSPTSGNGSAGAHVIEAGMAGNLPAGAIDVTCPCGTSRISGVLVTNSSAFSGGLNAQTVAVIQALDINAAVKNAQAQVLSQILENLALQMQPSEEQITKASCATQITTDHPVGAEVAQAFARTSLTCQEVVFDRARVEQAAATRFLRVADRYANPNQALSQLKAMVIGITGGERTSAFVFTVRVSASWMLRMNQDVLQTLRRHLAGLTSDQAARYLHHFPGIERSTIEQPYDWLPLPIDPQHIVIIAG